MEAGPSTPRSTSVAQTTVASDDDEDHSVMNGSPPPSAIETSQDIASPHGPMCDYGPRLGYCYFFHGAPEIDGLAKPDSDTFWFTIDHQLVYLSFFQDTGPLNVAMFYRFALHLHSLLDDENLMGKKIVLYSSAQPDKKANAALLIALYAMIVMRWSLADALHPIACLEIQPFRDAGYARADYHLSVQDVLLGMKKAIDLRLLRLDSFDLKEYEMYEKVENGDWNYITPHFLAFASPVEPGYAGSTTTGPTGSKLPKSFRNVLEQFEAKNVQIIVRLNKKLYAVEHFTEKGFEHVEMYFDDGTNPTMDMCRQFIALSERVIKAGGVVAVHCKAGLGRTGTLIGAYMIYKWGFTASEAIGFMRMMRPGSVVGPQQHFLNTYQLTFVKWSVLDGSGGENGVTTVSAPRSIERPMTPPSDHEIAADLARPSTPTNNVAVPGQPRKTPGRTRHAVAAPETAPQETEDIMQGVETTPSIQSRETTPYGTSPVAIDTAPVRRSSAAGLRPRARPLSAITDNRVINSNGALPPSDELPAEARGVTRSKGSRNLLFQDAGSGERYNLRREPASRSPPTSPPPASLQASTSHNEAKAADPAPTTRSTVRSNVYTSPSRLPQRVVAKRRVVSRNGSSNGPPLTAGGNHSARLTRNVRRRRSSMGATDVKA